MSNLCHNSRKAGSNVGRDNVIASSININDLTNLYLRVLGGLLAGTADHGREGGWYYGATHEHTWYKVAQALAAALSKRGLVDSQTDVTSFEQQYMEQHVYGSHGYLVFGRDMRAVG